MKVTFTNPPLKIRWLGFTHSTGFPFNFRALYYHTLIFDLDDAKVEWAMAQIEANRVAGQSKNENKKAT